jgi:MFS family permease
VEDTGVIWVTLGLTDSPVLLGFVGLARAGPAIILSPIAGVIADRTDQQRLLNLTQVASLLSTAALGMIVILGAVTLVQVYLLVAVQSSLAAFDSAARQAFFPRLVHREELSEAVTLTSMAGRVSQLVGPAVAGLAIALSGEAAPFAISAIACALMVATLVSISGVPRLTPPVRGSFRTDLGDGLRYIGRIPVLRGLLSLEVVFSMFQLNAIMIAIVGRLVLGVGPEGLGGLLSAPALGSLAAVTGLLMIGAPVRQGQLIVLCTMAYAGVLIVFSATTDYLVALVIVAIAGALDTLVTITRHSVMQLATPQGMRGRVMANMGTVTRGAGTLGEFQAGAMAGLLGPSRALLVASMIIGSAAIVTVRSTPEVWRFVRRED